MKNHTTYTPYRKSLAWIGFGVIFLALPLLLSALVYNFSTLNSTTYDRDTRVAPDTITSEARQS